MLDRLQPSVDVDSEEGIRFLATLEKQFRRTDLAGITKPDEIAICLIEATAEQSVLVLDRLSPQLDCYVAGHGFASFPADATTAEGLNRHARLTMAGG
jgi:hypothetical protein